MTKRQLKLVYLSDDSLEPYKVILVKNSIEYVPGDLLTEKEVDYLCGDYRWDVTIVGPLPK